MKQFYPIQKTNESFLTKRKVSFTKSNLNKYSTLLLFVFGLFFTNFSFAQVNTYTTTGTWVCPYGVTSVQVEAWGGGAGGVSTPNTNNANGGGGGGGAYAKRNAITVVPGTTYNFTIGTGGGASTAGNNTTATINGVVITAAGGSVGTSSTIISGLGGIGGTSLSSVGDVKYAGGNGANGTYLGSNNGNGGGGGSGAGTSGAGNNGAVTTAGTLKANFGGAGGAGGVSSNGVSASAAAGNYGGGGGGAGHKNNSGGSGTGGAMIFTYTCPSEIAAAGLDINPACGATTTTLAGNTPSSAGLLGAWTVVSGTATITTPSSATSGVTGLASSGTATLRWTINNGLCGTTFDDVVITTKATPVITGNPSNSSILVGANTSFTVTASNSPTSYTWEVSTNGGGTWSTVTNGGVYSTATAATLNITAAPLSMNGYMYRATATNSCGTSVVSTAATLTVSLLYCTPVGSSAAAFGFLTNVNVNGSAINRTSVYDGYINTGLTTTLLKGFTYTLSLGMNNSSTTGRWTAAWADWNLNGTLNDAGENIAPAAISTLSPTDTRTLTFTVPAGATTGSIKLRVVHTYEGGTYAAPTPCAAAYVNQSDWEDYTLNVIDAVPCTTPATQPTGLSLTAIAAGFNGSFTAAVPAPNNYIVVANTTGIAPTPANGTTYTVGSTMGAGNIVTAITSGTTFTTSFLSGSTSYYIYVFSYNDLCSGGPLYLIPSPLTGNGTTLVESYCTPTVSAGYATANYINTVNFVGNLVNTNNTSTNNNVAPIGYQDFTGLGSRATQAQNEGVNIFLDTNQAAAVFMKAWVDWNKDGVFTDATEIVYQCSNAFLNTTFGFQVPGTVAPGNYRIRFRINKSNTIADNTYTACGNIVNYGETEDYLITVVQDCPAKITSITPNYTCGTGTTTLGAVGTAGTTEYRWYTLASGGGYTATPSTTWTTPSISVTTTYYVTAFNGTCESLFRTAVVATVKPVATLTLSNATPSVCGENSIIDLSAVGTNEQVYLIDENFEGGLGVFTGAVYGTQNTALTNWSVKTSTYVPVYPTYPVWYPAVSSGFGTNKFALTTSDIVAGGNTFGKIDNAIESATVNSTGFLNLTLTFNMYFSSYYDNNSAATEYVVAEYKNGAGAWTLIPGGQYLIDEGIGTQFVFKSLNMNAFTGITNLKVRIRYKAGWCDGVAIDNVKLFGDRALIPNITWTSALPVDAYTNAACTIPYVAGTPVSAVWVKPTLAQLEQGTYSFTANANLTNGCTISSTVNVTNTSNVWKGTTDNDWNKASNWLPAIVPTASSCVIIPTGSSSQIMNAPNALAKNLTIKAPTGNLELQSGRNLIVTDWINVEAGATFNVRNSANLVQITASPVPANSGSINMQRNANVRLQDYVYYASPVVGFASSAISPSTSYIYKWTPTIGTNTNGWGNWTGGSETMTAGKGYIVRGPSAYSNALASNYTATFAGAPNNGTITTPVLRGAYNGADYSTGVSTTLATKDDDNWNLLGNPYPSAINPTQFLAANTNLAGFVKIWTHGTLPVSLTDPFYQDFGYNYTPGDYVTYNGSGSTAGPGVSQISAGQGFFTLMNHTSAAASENVTFTNAMRRDGSGNPYNNSQFFKDENKASADNHRIWLDLVTATNKNVRTLVGYIDGATDGSDRLYDAFTDEKLSLNLYSLIGTEKFNIQGKQLPFENTDFVPMGFKTSESGTHNIAIAAVDGIFSDASQNIIIEDKLLNKTHNLKESPYTFTTTAGTFNDRFVLRYSKTTLSTHESEGNTVKVFASNNGINISSTSKLIKEIVVYDILGKTVINKSNINKPDVTLNELKQTSTMLIVKVTLENNEEVVTKVIY